MIISPNDGVENHESSSFTITDQAVFGEDIQIFAQSSTSNQPSIVSTPTGNNAWFFSGSHSFSLIDTSSADTEWSERGMYSCWFYWQGEGGDMLITCRDAYDYRIAWGFNSALGMNFSNTTSTYLHSSSSLQPDGWHYLELVLNCSNLTASNRGKLYVDRQFVSPINIAGTWPTSMPGGTTFEVGKNASENYLHGLMGNFYVCSEIPSDENRDVIGNYQRPITGSF